VHYPHLQTLSTNNAAYRNQGWQELHLAASQNVQALEHHKGVAERIAKGEWSVDYFLFLMFVAGEVDVRAKHASGAGVTGLHIGTVVLMGLESDFGQRVVRLLRRKTSSGY
jgi:hypothetical protein